MDCLRGYFTGNQISIPRGILFVAIIMQCMVLHAQESDTVSNAHMDTVVLSPSQIKQVTLNCYIINAYGSGDEELIAINSKSDAISAFGYNCDIPDSDYTNYTLLCCSVKSSGEINSNIKMTGDNLLLTVNTYKGMGLMRRYFIRLLIPKIARNSNLHLDINAQ